MIKYILLVISMFSIGLSENKSTRVVFEQNLINIDMGEVEKQLKTRLNTVSINQEEIGLDTVQHIFGIFGTNKICIGGEKSGEICTNNSECDLNICKNPKEFYQSSINYNDQEGTQLNTSFKMSLGANVKGTCNGFTVGFQEKLGLLIRSIMDYIQNHLLPNILFKAFGIPTGKDIGSKMKWAVDIMAQMACVVKTLPVTTLKTAGTAGVVYNKEKNSTVEIKKQKDNGIAIHKGSAVKKTDSYQKHGTNKAAGKKTEKQVKKEATDAAGEHMQKCVEEVKLFWNDFLQKKINTTTEEKEEKMIKSLCDLAKTVETVNVRKKVIIDPSFQPKTTRKKKIKTIFGPIEILIEDNTQGNKKREEKDRSPAKVWVNTETLKSEIIKNDKKLIESEQYCPLKSYQKGCEEVQNFLIDINYCIEQEIKSNNNIENDKGTGVYPNFCSALTCKNSENKNCYLHYRFDGRGSSPMVEGYIPFLPITFENHGSEVTVSLIEKLKRKKDICNVLEAQSEIGIYRIINSYIVSKYVETTAITNVSEVEKKIKNILVDKDKIEKEYNQYVSDYCERQMEIELKIANKLQKEKINRLKKEIEKYQIDLVIRYKKHMNIEAFIEENIDNKIINACTYPWEEDKSKEKMAVIVRTIISGIPTFTIKYIKVIDNIITVNSIDYDLDTRNSLIEVPIMFDWVENEETLVLKEETDIEDHIDSINEKIKKGVEAKTTFDEKVSEGNRLVNNLKCRPIFGGVYSEEQIEKIKKNKKDNKSTEDIQESLERKTYGSDGLIERKYKREFKEIVNQLEIQHEILDIIETKLLKDKLYIKD